MNQKIVSLNTKDVAPEKVNAYDIHSVIDDIVLLEQKVVLLNGNYIPSFQEFIVKIMEVWENAGRFLRIKGVMFYDADNPFNNPMFFNTILDLELFISHGVFDWILNTNIQRLAIEFHLEIFEPEK